MTDASKSASEAPAPADGLQFDRAELAEGAPAAFTCRSCHQPIISDYFSVNDQPMCGRCRSILEQHFLGPIAWRTWLRVFAYGSGAALLGTLIYFAVLKITGYELGLIAIVVGLLVGGAVRKASGFRGGWKLQAAAMGLTYASIVSSYIPTVVEGVMQSEKKQTADAEQARRDRTDRSAGRDHDELGKPQRDPGPGPDQRQGRRSSSRELRRDKRGSSSEKEEIGFFKFLGYLVVAGVIIFGIAAAAPILAGFQNFMGWIIIAIALYEAWKLNRQVPFRVAGPLPVPIAAAQAPAPAAAPIESESDSASSDGSAPG